MWRRSEPTRAMRLIFNKIAKIWQKRTQAVYHPWYQSVMGVYGLNLRKFVSMPQRSIQDWAPGQRQRQGSKRTQLAYAIAAQQVSPNTLKANPLYLSCFLSITYSNFQADFGGICTDASAERSRIRPSRAIQLKLRVITAERTERQGGSRLSVPWEPADAGCPFKG
jgi:hypothetical protein